MTDSLTAALSRTLNQAAAANPYTNAPYTDAMLFGLSGGLGLGYILWEFKKNNTAPVVLGLTRRWNYPTERLAAAAARTGLTFTIHETASTTKADHQLAQACGEDPLAPLIYVDWFHCPFGWVMTASQTPQGWTVQDTGQHPVLISDDVMSEARNAYPSLKHRLIRFTEHKQLKKSELKQNCSDAIKDMSAYLSSGSDSFGLPALKKWHRLLTHDTHKKGWPTVFKRGRNLAPALATLYQRTVLTGTDGRALRPTYAAFLREAAPILNRPNLDHVADLYDRAGVAWRQLGHAALAKDDPLRQALDQRARAHARGGKRGVTNMQTHDAHVQAHLKSASYPADPNLFSTLSEKLRRVYDLETQALQTLDDARE